MTADIPILPAPASGGIDVLIAGAGPVGLVLATELVRRGVIVRIVDALPTPTTESRAIVVHSRSLDALEILGCLQPLMERAIVARGMQIHADEKTIAAVSFQTINAVHPYSASVSQTDTEAVITDRLAELGVTVERPTTLTGFSQDADGVDVTLTDTDGSTRLVRARYLVGADGAGSTVRHLMGQKLEGTFRGEDFLLGDVEADHDYDRSEYHTFFSPRETTGLLFPLPGDRVRVFAQLATGTDPHRPVTVEWMQDALDERGMRLRIRDTHWLTRIELKHGQVPHYGDGRVFLAGDAAHIHSPAGGLGMNTGIQDAMNLGWKLAEALRTGDTPTLLDSYHLERHPVAAAVIAFTTRLSEVGTVNNPIAQHARNIVVQLGFELPGFAERIAGTVEQQNVRYRNSPVVSGSGVALRPGDYLYLPDTVVASALAAHPTHLAVVLPEPGTTRSAQLPEWIAELSISDHDSDILRQSVGLQRGGLVVIRPDGYIGHISADVNTGVESYSQLIGRVSS